MPKHFPQGPGPGGLDPTHENKLDDHLDVAAPEGLNYDEKGELVAVFSYHGIDVKDWLLANLVGDQAAVNALFNPSVRLSSVSAATGGVVPKRRIVTLQVSIAVRRTDSGRSRWDDRRFDRR